MKNAYEQTTIKKVAKLLRHLERNCNTSIPRRSQTIHSKERMLKRTQTEPNRSIRMRYSLIRTNMGTAILSKIQQETKSTQRRTNRLLNQPRKNRNGSKTVVIKRPRTAPKRINMANPQRHRSIHMETYQSQEQNTRSAEKDKLKTKSLELLRIIIKKKNLTANSHIYNGTSDNLANDYRHYRNRLADEYDMPELKQIQLYDFRRFKASKTYHLTNNLLLVKQLLGHKHVEQTEHYISLFDEKSITWIPVIAKNQAEIEQAIKDDCILVCQAEGITYFKKPA